MIVQITIGNYLDPEFKKFLKESSLIENKERMKKSTTIEYTLTFKSTATPTDIFMIGKKWGLKLSTI